MNIITTTIRGYADNLLDLEAINGVDVRVPDAIKDKLQKHLGWTGEVVNVTHHTVALNGGIDKIFAGVESVDDIDGVIIYSTENSNKYNSRDLLMLSEFLVGKGIPAISVSLKDNGELIKAHMVVKYNDEHTLSYVKLNMD